MSQHIVAQGEMTGTGPAWRAAALPGLLALAVVAAALAGGLLAGPTSTGPVEGVLGLSARSSAFVYRAGDLLPLGFAFAAGMVAAVNPCGFVMLPAYLTLYVSDVEGAGGTNFGRRLLKGLMVSAAVGLGFVLLFGITGTAISAGARPVARVFPWIGFALGFVLAATGAYLLAGGRLYSGAAAGVASRIGDPRDASLRGYFLFGVSYAVASLSCTLPIFLGLISSSLAGGGFISAAGEFVAYALGMTAVIGVLTMAIALFKGALVNPLRRVMPYVSPISAGILIAVGGYLIYYWLTEGGLAGKF